MTLDNAIKAVADEAPDEYTRAYAGAAMQAADEAGTHGLEAQVRYILANLSTWRGARAAKVKMAMRRWLQGRL